MLTAALRESNGASRRRLLLLKALVAATLAVMGAVGMRMLLTQSFFTSGLVWNLILAWVPFLLALVVYDGARRGVSGGALTAVGALWLLFLPNAPYIVTDFKWLREYESGAPWLDALLIGSAAAIGLVLGFLSLYLVQAVVAQRLGRLVGWVVAFGALAASGVGVYLGRFQRWNSWDVFTEPTRIVGQLGSAAFDPLQHGRPLAFSILFAVAWCTGYALFYSAFHGQLRRLEER